MIPAVFSTIVPVVAMMSPMLFVAVGAVVAASVVFFLASKEQ